MKKKTYVKPQIEVVKVNVETAMLVSSPNNDLDLSGEVQTEEDGEGSSSISGTLHWFDGWTGRD